MSTWDKNLVIFSIIDASTGEIDTNSYTVQVQPVDQAYPTGAISCTQLSNGKWKPDSDLDTENAYDIYKNGSRIGRLWGIDLMPAIGV